MVKDKDGKAYKSTEMIQLKGSILRRDILTEVEQKAIMYIASQVKKDSQPEDKYLFEYRKFIAVAGIEKYGKLYKDMCEMIEGLSRKQVKFRDEDAKGNKIASMVVSPTFYDSGAIQYKIDENLLPHFKAFSDGFTMIDVADYMRIRGKHPLALYELMLSWATHGRVKYTIDDLRQKLNIPDNVYPRNTDFVRQIRLAIEEINGKSQKIQVETEEITGSRNKVEAIVFKIKNLKPTAPKTYEEELEDRGQTSIMDAMSEQAATTTTAVQKEKSGHKCPKCETGRVVLKNGKNGEFWGCNNFDNGCKYHSDDSPEVVAEKKQVEEKKKERSKPKADCPKCNGLGYRPVLDENGEDTLNSMRHCDCWGMEK